MFKVVQGSIAIIFRRTDSGPRFLITQNRKTGNFTFPGGALEEGENFLSAIKRELLEEINLEVKEEQIQEIPLKHEFVFNKKKTKRYGQQGSYQFFLIELNEEIVEVNPKEVVKAEWLTFKDAANLLTHQDLKEFLKKAVKYIK